MIEQLFANKPTELPYNYIAKKSVYHVTLTNSVASIKRDGITPMHTTNWTRADKSRYGEGYIYAFENEMDAIRWASNWDWHLNEKFGSGKVSIVEIKAPGSKWQIDTNDPLTQANSSGKWIKRFERIKPDQIGHIKPFSLADMKLLVKNTNSRFKND